MLKVRIPKNGASEVKYTMFCLLKEFLGLEYELEVDASVEDFIFEYLPPTPSFRGGVECAEKSVGERIQEYGFSSKEELVSERIQEEDSFSKERNDSSKTRIENNFQDKPNTSEGVGVERAGKMGSERIQEYGSISKEELVDEQIQENQALSKEESIGEQIQEEYSISKEANDSSSKKTKNNFQDEPNSPSEGGGWGEVLTIKNHFFKTDDPSKLFHPTKIPDQVTHKDLFLNKKNYPHTSIFGEAKIQEEGNSITLESDIISSTFFMLSRWEEWALEDRDHFERFPATSSLAVKFDFLEKPVVNEYVEILWVLLQKIGVQQKRKERKFEIIPTHDVDRPYLWWSFPRAIYDLSKLIAKLKFKEFFKQFSYFIKGEDPYDTHHLFMDLSEKKGVKSHFFFMTGGNHKFDNAYKIDHPRILKLIQDVKDRGHHIGIHPSFNSYLSPDFIQKEKAKLETAAGIPISTGRHHYLRFDTPKTWKIWDDLGMKWDATMTYASRVGFRCGVCYPYPVYDISQRKQLSLYERPTIVMEGSLVNYAKLSPSEAKTKIDYLKEEVRKYDGEFVFLWHNSFFNVENYMPYEFLLEVLYDL